MTTATASSNLPLRIGIFVVCLVIIVVGLSLLGPIYDLSRRTAHLPPSARAQAQEMLEQLAAAIERGDLVEAEAIARQLEHYVDASLEGLDIAQSKIICAWCNAVVGDSDTPEDTHSVCSQCKLKIVNGWGD